MLEHAADVVQAEAEGDLFERLDALQHAEPLDAEDDLILRMSSVSKLRSCKAAKMKRSERSASKAVASKPHGGIAKRKSAKKQSGVTLNRSNRATAAAVAAAAVATAAAELGMPGRPRGHQRSASI